jgi:Mrp family chromosome partitioning ATPase
VPAAQPTPPGFAAKLFGNAATVSQPAVKPEPPPPAPVIPDPPGAAEIAPIAPKPKLEVRPPTGAERAVRRTLGEPHRRQPLAELAARLRQDVRQTGSRTLLLAGIGPESATHDTALHVAALLADEGGKVLLADGELARRQLSADLDDLQERGLSDLTRENESPGDLLQPTAFSGLAFLPAGSERFADMETSANVLARSLGQLAAQFDLTLIGGGRCGEAGVAALARICDATYVVVQLGTVEAMQAQQALRDLRATGARVLGCIATGGPA